MAAELLLEDEPPVAAFESHGQGKSLTPVTFSSLVDHRRQAVHMARLRSLDDMVERRRRLGKGPYRKPEEEASGGGGAEAAGGRGRGGKKGDKEDHK